MVHEEHFKKNKFSNGHFLQAHIVTFPPSTFVSSFSRPHQQSNNKKFSRNHIQNYKLVFLVQDTIARIFHPLLQLLSLNLVFKVKFVERMVMLPQIVGTSMIILSLLLVLTLLTLLPQSVMMMILGTPSNLHDAFGIQIVVLHTTLHMMRITFHLRHLTQDLRW